jgi:CrcB protein
MEGRSEVAEPTDSDVDLHVPAQRRELLRGPWRVLIAVAAGGALGAALRYGASLVWPVASGRFPWTTLWVNVSGSALIGVFMVVVSDVWAAHRLVRPFFGTGVLGGFTTFSTYAVDIERLVDTGRAGLGMAYLAVTLPAALTAVWSAVWATRRVLAWRTQ